MVSEAKAAPCRPGFTLVEVIVALALLAIGALGAAATQIVAARLLREAEDRTAAIVFAGNIIDSLLSVRSPAGGVREEANRRATWTSRAHGEGTILELEVQYQSGAGSRTLEFSVLHLPPLPRIAIPARPVPEADVGRVEWVW
jgi:type IV pilus modification protein PilV